MLHVNLTNALNISAPAASTNSNEDKGIEPPSTKDEDADGMKLLQCTDPLERAAKFLSPLASLTKDNIKAWIAIYDVAIRRSEPTSEFWATM